MAQKDLHSSQAVPPEKLDPGDDDGSTPDHYIDRSEGLLLPEPLRPLDQELKIGLDRTVIDVFWITSRRGWVIIAWHAIDMPDQG